MDRALPRRRDTDPPVRLVHPILRCRICHSQRGRSASARHSYALLPSAIPWAGSGQSAALH
jgi:hypothetical protein